MGVTVLKCLCVVVLLVLYGHDTFRFRNIKKSVEAPLSWEQFVFGLRVRSIGRPSIECNNARKFIYYDAVFHYCPIHIFLIEHRSFMGGSMFFSLSRAPRKQSSLYIIVIAAPSLLREYRKLNVSPRFLQCEAISIIPSDPTLI